VLIYILVIAESRGGGFYIQNRVGKDGIDFKLLKFRSMRMGSDNKGLITVGERDPRITKIGYFLRKFKLDELPQLLNVLFNEMSLVGPRPEVKKYVDMYSLEQREILKVKPGITDFASIYYNSENKILALAKDSENEYINTIMPHKINLNLKFIRNPTLKIYFSILFKTILSIFK
jgi:lipopolysaccharide/colanic/teichoic acid biosynthesis glycosyltransferase